MFCNKCGAQNAVGAQFCSRCGAAFAPAPAGAGAPYSEAAVASPYAPAHIAGQYAGFWIRFVAFIIDLFVVAIVVFPVSAVITVVTGGIPRIMGGDVQFRGLWFLGVLVRGLFNTLVSWIYEAALESSSKQATLGKMALGLKVTDLYGNRISFARATGRHFAKYISGVILGIGYIMAGFTERKQALHDMIAGTLVIRS
jgi:uncharacterized RDD family membrane protein YckC